MIHTMTAKRSKRQREIEVESSFGKNKVKSVMTAAPLMLLSGFFAIPILQLTETACPHAPL